jgi:hypothetical protein
MVALPLMCMCQRMEGSTALKVALPPQCSPAFMSPTWQYNQKGEGKEPTRGECSVGGNPLTAVHTTCSCVWGAIYPVRNSANVA